MDGDLGERGDTAQQTSFRLNAYVVFVLVVFVVVLVGFRFCADEFWTLEKTHSSMLFVSRFNVSVCHQNERN